MDDGQLALGIVIWMVTFLFGQHLQVGFAALWHRWRMTAQPAVAAS